MERGAWTDQKLDDFRDRVELRFDQVDQRFNAMDNQMRDGFARVDGELLQLRAEVAGIHETMHRFAGRIMIALGGVIAGLVGVVAALFTTS